MVASAEKRAAESNILFSLTEEKIVIPDLCPVFGVVLVTGDRKNNQNSPSLDRLLPEKGYTPENVFVISRRANVVKNNGTAEEHRKIAKWIVTQQSLCPTHNTSAGETEQKLVNKARERSKKRGLPFDLKKTDISVPHLCPILGIPLIRGEGKLHENSPTLDRFVGEAGYVHGNVAVVSYRANRMKNDGTAEEHLKIANWMDKMCGTITKEPNE